MSNTNPTVPTALGEFQSHFGGPPGSSDAISECKKWEKLCAELLMERQTLREQLAKAQSECELYRKSLFHQKCRDFQTDIDLEAAWAHIDDKPSLNDLIAEVDASGADPKGSAHGNRH